MTQREIYNWDESGVDQTCKYIDQVIDLVKGQEDYDPDILYLMERIRSMNEQLREYGAEMNKARSDNEDEIDSLKSQIDELQYELKNDR